MRNVMRLAMLGALAACGCAWLPKGDSVDSMPEYQQARRQVNDPVGAGGRGVQPASYEEPPPKPEEDGPWYESFTLDGINKNSKRAYQKATGTAPNRDAARKLFAEAQAEYDAAAAMPDGPEQRAKFLEAAARFKTAGSRWPDSALQHDAMFMHAEALFFAHQYPKANEAYELTIKQYPNSRYIDQINAHRFAIAHWWLKLEEKDPESWYEVNVADKAIPWRDRFGHAIRIFDRIRLDDPMGNLADDATMAAGNALFAAREFIRADEYYSDLRRTFPRSEHQFNAHLLGMKAKMECYDGPDYSEKPLLEAEKLVIQMRKQFPREYAKEREQIETAYAEIRKSLAERLIAMARYYDRRAEYGSAKYYYREVANEFEGTPLADQAEQRIAELGGEPDVPPQKLKWLANMFPSEKQPQPKPLMATQPQLNMKR